MPDTKISSQTNVTPVLGTYLVPLSAGGLPRQATFADVQIFVNTKPVWAAGGTGAGTWPKFTAGPLLTTPEAGAIELDTTNLYGSVEASNRGIITLSHFIRANAARTLASQTTAQAIFNSPANGQITLTAGVYEFRALIGIDTMSATAGNARFGLGGTATLTQILQTQYGIDAGFDSVANVGGTATQAAVSGATNGSIAATGTEFWIAAEGSFSAGAGTVIPQIFLTTAAAAIIKIGSFVKFTRLGAAGVVSVGNWS